MSTKMVFNSATRRTLQSAFSNHALGLFNELDKYPRLKRYLVGIQQTIIKEAARVGGDEAAEEAKARVNEATLALATDPERAEAARNELREPLLAAANRIAEDDVNLGDAEFVEFEPSHVTGAWQLQHYLAHVRSIEETPPAPGSDDMFLAGNYTYNGSGPLKPYFRVFDQGEEHYPSVTLAQVQIVPGTRTYEATHLIMEEDGFSGVAANWIAVSLTFLLDLLIEAGILVLKRTLRAWMMSQKPDGTTKKEWEEYVEEALDSLKSVVDEGSDTLLGILSDWVAEALGPETFPIARSKITIEWNPPGPPVWRRARFDGSERVRGVPPAGVAPGQSIIVGGRVERSGGGEYMVGFNFSIVGAPGRW